MKRTIRLQIDEPCHEDWNRMRPEDLGRHCSSCNKIVIDFSSMSDQELIGWLAPAGHPNQGVFGRLASDQVNRPLYQYPAAQKNYWPFRSLVFAGLLLATRLSAQQKPTRLPVRQVKMAPMRQARISNGLAPLASMHTPISPVMTPVNSLPHVTDSFKTLTPVVVTAWGTTTGLLLVGGISSCVKITSWKQRVADTLQAILPFNKEFIVYPNPVRRGANLGLAWQTDPGVYQVGIYTVAGALVEQKTISVGDKTQTDLFGIPSTLAAGIYIIRANGPNPKKVYTRKIVVM